MSIEIEVGYGFPDLEDDDELCIPRPGVPGYGPQHTRGQTCSTCRWSEEFEVKRKKARSKASALGRSKVRRRARPGAPKSKLVVVYDCTLYGVEVREHCTCDSWEERDGVS